MLSVISLIPLLAIVVVTTAVLPRTTPKYCKIFKKNGVTISVIACITLPVIINKFILKYANTNMPQIIRIIIVEMLENIDKNNKYKCN